MVVESEPQMGFDMSVDLTEESFEVANVVMFSDEFITTISELFLPLVIITIILGGITIYYLYKFFKKFK